MSILEFMEMNVLECVLGSVLAFMICLSYSGIGAVFAPKRGAMFQSVLGMTFMGAIGVLGAEFCAGLVKYLIGLLAIVGLAILVVRIVTHEVSIKNILISMMPALIFYAIAFINILVIVLPKSGVFPYNCHQTYFSGVSLEILNADYFSRLRIMDVYPFEWSKYHFFNGAYISIPLIAFAKGNYVSYLFAKMISISYYVGAIFDLLKSKYTIKKANLYLGLGIGAFFACAHNGIVWSMATNNYSCIVMCLIAWLLFEEKSYAEATLFSIGYAITKSGSIISGGCLFLYGLYMMYRADQLPVFAFLKKWYREAVFSLVLGMGVLTTAFVGRNPSGQSAIIFGSLQSMISEMYNGGWMCVMPLGAVIAPSDSYSVHLEFLYIVAVAYLVIRNRSKLIQTINKYKKLAVLLGLIIVLDIAGAICIYKNVWYVVFGFVIWYLLPLLAILACVTEQQIITYIVYCVSLAVNFILFNAGVTVPNYCIVVFVSLCYFVKQFQEDFEITKKISQRILYMIMLFGILYFGVNDWHTILMLSSQEELVLDKVAENADKSFEYFSKDDANCAKLNALKGNRVHYNVLPDVKDETMSKISMAMRFLTDGYEAEYYNTMN